MILFYSPSYYFQLNPQAQQARPATRSAAQAAAQSAAQSAVRLNLWLVLLFLFCLLPSFAWAEIGKIESLTGKAQIHSATGIIRPAAVDGDLALGESIKTGRKGRVTLRLADRSIFEISPNTEMRMDEFMFDVKTKHNMKARFFNGAFKYISGLQGKKNKTRQIVFPNANIGIRGTKLVGIVDTDSKIVLLEGAIDISTAFGTRQLEQPNRFLDIANNGQMSQEKTLTVNDLLELEEVTGLKIEADLPPIEETETGESESSASETDTDDSTQTQQTDTDESAQTQEADSAETDSAEAETVATETVETENAETKNVETETVETGTVETETVETETVETETVEASQAGELESELEPSLEQAAVAQEAEIVQDKPENELGNKPKNKNGGGLSAVNLALAAPLTPNLPIGISQNNNNPDSQPDPSIAPTQPAERQLPAPNVPNFDIGEAPASADLAKQAAEVATYIAEETTTIRREKEGADTLENIAEDIAEDIAKGANRQDIAQSFQEISRNPDEIALQDIAEDLAKGTNRRDTSQAPTQEAQEIAKDPELVELEETNQQNNPPDSAQDSAQDNSQAPARESQDNAQAPAQEAKDNARDTAQDNSQSGAQDESQSGAQDDSQGGAQDGSQSGAQYNSKGDTQDNAQDSKGDTQDNSKGDTQDNSQDGSQSESQDETQSETEDNSKGDTQDNAQDSKGDTQDNSQDEAQGGAQTPQTPDQNAQKNTPPDNSIDSDNDGLPDSEELILGTNPNAADSDNDSISDFAEMAGLTNH